MTFLKLTNISKQFGKTFVVENFNLDVERGEFVSFLGPSGCGKTTTLRMVAGFEEPSSGTIFLDDKDITNITPAKRNIGMVFQAYALFPNMTIAKNIAYGLEVARKPHTEINKRVGEMLELINMPEMGNRYPYQLSGGQQQRVALARALAVHPQVLLLDEPLSALDAKIRASLRTEIRAIQKTLGITAIYVTHDQEEALCMSDRVVVMNNGMIEQIDQPFAIYNSPRTAFVAQFVGTLNTLPAQVVDAAAGFVNIYGQTIQVSGGWTQAHNGDTLTIALRPELLSFASEDNKRNSLEGIVDNVTFLGSIVRLSLSISGRSIYMDTFNVPHLVVPTIGSKVRINCDPDSILILDHTTCPTPQG